MKKLVMIAAMMVAAVCANAQKSLIPVGGFGLMPKVGLNVSQVSGDHTKFKAGIAAGIEGQYQINEWLGLSAGLMYEQQGSGFEHSDYKLKTEYINVPILVKFYVVKGLSLNVGLQPGFMTKGKFGDSNEIDVKDDLNTFDFSMPFSVAYEFPIGLSVEARFTDGLTNVFKSDNNSWWKDADKNKNQILQLTVGYKFAL